MVGYPAGTNDEPTDAFDPVADVPHRSDRDQFPSECGLFVVESGPKAGSRYGLEAPLTSVGRHGQADILLDDVTVSRRHVEVERIADRYLVRKAGTSTPPSPGVPAGGLSSSMLAITFNGRCRSR